MTLKTLCECLLQTSAGPGTSSITQLEKVLLSRLLRMLLEADNDDELKEKFWNENFE